MKRTQVQTIHVILISFILCAVSVSALSPRSINVYKNKRQNEYKLSEEEREKIRKHFDQPHPFERFRPIRVVLRNAKTPAQPPAYQKHQWYFSPFNSSDPEGNKTSLLQLAKDLIPPARAHYNSTTLCTTPPAPPSFSGEHNSRIIYCQNSTSIRLNNLSGTNQSKHRGQIDTGNSTDIRVYCQSLLDTGEQIIDFIEDELPEVMAGIEPGGMEIYSSHVVMEPQPGANETGVGDAFEVLGSSYQTEDRRWEVLVTKEEGECPRKDSQEWAVLSDSSWVFGNSTGKG